MSLRINIATNIQTDTVPAFANANPTWTYDAAGNRTDSVCDNLNRTTSILGGAPTTCDVLGNRKSWVPVGDSHGGWSYSWDVLNRLTSVSLDGATQNSPSGYGSYTYRADGMRTSKVTGAWTQGDPPANGTTGTIYRYDGQMGFEDVDEAVGGALTVTDYGIGARGIDYIASTKSGTTTVGFPVYDAHGSMVACLFRGANNTYSISNQRAYDAWGNVRQGAASGDPKGRYCASIGHKQDDESGLTYMRARYYDGSSGRFISEDPGRSGPNWTVYGNCDPVNDVDQTGKLSTAAWACWVLGILTSICCYFANPLLGLIVGVISTNISLGVSWYGERLAAQAAEARLAAALASELAALKAENAALRSMVTAAADRSLAGIAVDDVAESEGQIEGTLFANAVDACSDDLSLTQCISAQFPYGAFF